MRHQHRCINGFIYALNVLTYRNSHATGPGDLCGRDTDWVPDVWKERGRNKESEGCGSDYLRETP
jgi:hypothetical protein